jgi:DNA-binding CsgD family transcriptional regulator
MSPAVQRALQVRSEVDTDAEAAQRLSISIHTIRAYLKSAREFYGVHSTQRAIRLFRVRRA